MRCSTVASTDLGLQQLRNGLAAFVADLIAGEVEFCDAAVAFDGLHQLDRGICLQMVVTKS